MKRFQLTRFFATTAIAFGCACSLAEETMGSPYIPDGSAYHDSALVPDDADPPEMSSFNPPIEAALDNAEYLRTHSPRMQSQEFLATAVSGFTVPTRVTKMMAIMVGGGGGGGGGKGGGTSTAISAAGGGGGAGAHLRVAHLVVTPGDVLDITIGAGGSGGAGGAPGGNGNTGASGGDSIIAIHGGAELARAKGAGGGTGGTVNGNGTSVYAFSPGGFGAPSNRGPAESFTSSTNSPVLPCGYGAGGASVSYGNTSGQSYRGHPSLEGFDGGINGSYGSISGSYFTGGAGGGGGAGPYGAGPSVAAAGSNANGAGTATAGATGSSASANTGAGGQGGSGGAAGSVAGSSGADGGTGGSGRVILIWAEDDS